MCLFSKVEQLQSPFQAVLPKGEDKGRIVNVRFTGDDLKAMAAAAKARKQTLSQWIRSTIHGTLQ
jgi:hypothetical protein